MTAPISGPIRVLVTGFGAFPGARSNPTAALVGALQRDRPRLARLGIELVLEILPVAYAEVAPRLESLGAAHRPEAILHFGLAARRKRISIETRAVNRVSRFRRDAAAAMAERGVVLPGFPLHLRATFGAVEIAAALRRAGIDGHLSNNAGKYVCNQTLFLSLARSDAAQIGFIHVPRLARGHPRGCAARDRPTRDDLTHDDLIRATIFVILTMARKARALRRGQAAAKPGTTPAATSLDPAHALA